MNDKVREIKEKLNLNDRDLAIHLAMNRVTMYKRMKDNSWTEHEKLYIKHKHKQL